MTQEYGKRELQLIYSTMYSTYKHTFHPAFPLGGACSCLPYLFKMKKMANFWGFNSNCRENR